MARVHVRAAINGEPVEFLCDAHETLLTALRDAVGLTGTKEGCATGDCGACSIIMNGRLVPSCLVLAPEAENKTITTIEGIAASGALHPPQRQFLDDAARPGGNWPPGVSV